MNLFRFNIVACSESEFVSFWARFYEESKYPDSIYKANLNEGKQLNQANIKPLLEWKNGRPLSKKKQEIAVKVINNLPRFNQFRLLTEVTQMEFEKFWMRLSKIVKTGLVWRVFLLHMARPEDYPIVDQHVLRAYHYLTRGKIAEPEQTLQAYESYRTFFGELVEKSGEEHRHVDKALMCFGQFLNSQFFKHALQHSK
jgi:hypothetical protein